MTKQEIIELRKKRAGVLANAQAEHKRSVDEKRDATADELKKYSDYMAEFNKLGDTIKREEDLLAGAEELAKTGRDLNAGSADEGDEGNADEGAEERNVDPRAGAKYRNIFGRLLRGEIDTKQARREARALQVGNDIGGGFLVAPTAFTMDLLKDLDNEVFVRRFAPKVTSGPNGVGQPSLDTDLDDYDWTTELATGNEDDIEIGRRESKPHPMAKRVKVSRTLASNSNIEAILRERLSYKLGITQEKAYLTGSGAQQPLGVFTASTLGISTSRDVSTGNETTNVTFNGLKSARGALKAAHRRSARWLFHRDAVTRISKLVDGNGQYLWEVSTKVGEPDMLLGCPVDESEYAPSTFTTGLYVGLLANWKFYQIVDSLDLQIQVLNELYAETNQIGMIARYEGDGQPTREEAFVRVKLA